MGEDYTRLQASVEEAKRAHLPYDPDDPPILHREDILHRRGPFHVLRDDATRAAFDGALIELVSTAPITIFGVVIDKFSHGSKACRNMTDAYHYCLAAMLERYCGLLAFLGAVGDVLVEARGKTEDRTLKGEFRWVRLFFVVGRISLCGSEAGGNWIRHGVVREQRRGPVADGTCAVSDGWGCSAGTRALGGGSQYASMRRRPVAA